MNPIDGAGALNPVLNAHAGARPTDTSQPKSQHAPQVGDSAHSFAGATDGHSDSLGHFVPVTGPHETASADLPRTMKSSAGSFDIYL